MKNDIGREQEKADRVMLQIEDVVNKVDRMTCDVINQISKQTEDGKGNTDNVKC